MRALLGADAAALTGVQIDIKPGGFFDNALHRAIDPAGRAFNAFFTINHGPLGAPVARQHGVTVPGYGAKVVGNLLGVLDGVGDQIRHP